LDKKVCTGTNIFLHQFGEKEISKQYLIFQIEEFIEYLIYEPAGRDRMARDGTVHENHSEGRDEGATGPVRDGLVKTRGASGKGDGMVQQEGTR
jgi:hypothetical protein